MIFRFLFILVFAALLLNAKSQEYELMPGKYTLEIVLTDSEESYPASISFRVNDEGSISNGKVNYPTYDCKAAIKDSSKSKDIVKFQEEMLFGYDSCAPSKYSVSVNKKYFYNPSNNQYMKFKMFDGEENVQVRVKRYNYKATKYANFRIKHKIKNNNKILNSTNSHLLRQFISLVQETSVKNRGKNKLTRLIAEEKKEYLNANKIYTLSAYKKYISKYPASKFIKKAKLKIAKIEKEQLIALYRKTATVDSYYSAYRLSNEDIDIRRLLLKIENLKQLKAFNNKHADFSTHQLVKNMYIKFYREQKSAKGYYNSFLVSKNDDDIVSLLVKIGGLEELKNFISDKPILKKHVLIQAKLANFYRGLDSIEGYMNAYELLQDKKDLTSILDLSITQLQLEHFLSFYTNDDKTLTKNAKKRLQIIYRKKNNFFGYISAYKLFKEIDDLKHAYNKAETAKEKAKIEQLSFERVKTKEAMVHLQLSINEPSYTKSNASSGMFSQSTQYGYVSISGNVKVRFSNDLPYKPTFGKYLVSVKLKLNIPLNKQVRSQWIGNSDVRDDTYSYKTVSLGLYSGNNLESENFDFTKQVFVSFDRGIQGGFTAIWPADIITVEVLDVDISWMGEDLSLNKKLSLNFNTIEKYQRSLTKPKSFVNGVYNKGVKLINNFANNSIGEYKSYSGSSSSSSSSSANNTSNKNNRSANSAGNAYAGVSGIRSNGNISGVPSYQVQCSSGRTVIIYKKNGTWYTGGSGHMGHRYDSWSTNEVADYVCK